MLQALLQKFYSSKTITSEKNGHVRVRKLFGRTSLFVNAYDQSSPYITRMWQAALNQIPKDTPIKQILVLGLGAGSIIPLLHKKFKHIHITACEWDPVMVELAKTSGLFPVEQTPEILIGDASQTIHTLTKPFDLIIVDLFSGPTSEAKLAFPPMLEGLQKLLAPSGYLLLNPFKKLELVENFKAYFSCHAELKYRYNHLAVFRHPGQGQVGDPLPQGFIHHTQSQDYLLGSWPLNSDTQVIGKSPTQGLRWHFGPLWLESFTTDQEPQLDLTAPSRMVIWQPISFTGKPPGWHTSYLQMNPRQHGFTDLTGQENFWEVWGSHAQRQRKKWLAQKDLEISEVPPETFFQAFHETKKLPSVRTELIRILKFRLTRQKTAIHLFGARDKVSGRVVAGLAVCDLPDVSQSIHLIAFTHPKFEKTQVGTGLIDHWLSHCQKSGIRFPHFGLVWTPGDPKGWQGYSKFKRQFNLYLLRYPAPLFRIVWQQNTPR